jgi:hypothetical protein
MHNSTNPQAAFLRERMLDRSNLIWINETFSRQQVYDLQSVCDAMVSLHRSEGYGLGLAEATFLGKPVVATNWSGNAEFMTPQNSLPVNYSLSKIRKDIGVYRSGQIWAKPNISHAAWLMRLVLEDEKLRERLSVAARHTMAHGKRRPQAVRARRSSRTVADAGAEALPPSGAGAIVDLRDHLGDRRAQLPKELPCSLVMMMPPARQLQSWLCPAPDTQRIASSDSVAIGTPDLWRQEQPDGSRREAGRK